MVYSFNIILTELCNAKCSHCYMNASSNIKEKKSMSKDQIMDLINKIPDNTKTIVLTGGEIYMEKDLLYYTISKITEKFNKNKDFSLGIESNGMFFYDNEQKVVKELMLLSELGVNYIRFSDDIFHQAGGIDLVKVRKIADYAKNIPIKIKYLMQEKALPLGRGIQLDTGYVENRPCMNSTKTLDNPYLFIDVNGNIYSCAWKCVPEIGNIFNESWKQIEINMHSELQQLILAGQINEAAQLYSGNNNTEIGCMLCQKVFVKNK